MELLNEKIELAQQCMTSLNQSVMNLSHKTSKVRDIGDEIVQTLLDYSAREASNKLFFTNIQQFSNCLLKVEDHRDHNVFFLHIIEGLRLYFIKN